MAPVLPDDRPPAPAVAQPRPTPATILARAAVVAAIGWGASLPPANPFNRQADLRTAAEPIPVAGVRDAGERSTRFLPVALNHFERGIQPIGQIGGELTAVAIAGRFAFAGVGPRLVAIDLADPARPVEVGRSEPAAGRLTDIEVAGGYAFATASVMGDDLDGSDPAGGLRVFDIRDPTRPRLVGRLSTPDGVDVGIDVAGRYAYIAELWGGLRIVDIAVPERPVLAGALPHAKSNGMPFDVKVVGDHAYVANWEYDGHISYGVDGLLVVDVSDPASPSPAGYLSTAQFGRPGRIAASGSRVFFPVRDREVWVLDAVNPTSPRLIGIIAGPAPAEDVPGTEIREIIAIRPVPDDEIAVVHESRGSDGEDGLYWRWVDIRDPVQPRDIASRATSGYVGVEWPAAGLIWDDRLAITTNRLGDFRVLGGIDRQRPYVAGGFPVRVFAEDQDVAVSEAGVVYVLTDYYRSALHVLDVRDPGQPRIKGTMLLGDVIRWGGGIAEHRGYVFISDYDGVRVIDARVPAAMREVARTEGLPGRLVVADRFAYLASPVRLSDDLSAPGEPGGLRVIDVRDPVHPLQLGYVPGDMTAVATDGRMIWVGAVCEGRFGETACVQAYDVSAPEQPMLAGQFIPPFAGNRIEDIVVGRGFAFVTESGSTSWHVFDIADPARIRLLRTYRDGWGARLALRGTTLFLGGGDERLRAFDVRDPPHLRETASFAMPDPEGNPVVDVSFAGDVVLAGTARAGLWLFDVRDFSGAR